MIAVGYCFLKFRIGKFYRMKPPLSKLIKIAAYCIFFLSAAPGQPGEVSKTKLYDINGNKSAELINNFYSSGVYSTIWDAKGYASGTYFIVAKFGEEIRQQKIVFMK